MDKDLRPRQLTGYSRRTHLSNALFLLPTIVLFTFVVLIPFFQGIPYSFTSWKSIVSTDHPFNGIANYKYLLGNKYFRMSLGVTFNFWPWRQQNTCVETCAMQITSIHC